MPVVVTDTLGERTTYDNGDDWGINTQGALDVTMLKDNISKIISTYAPGCWSSVKKAPREDKALMFEEALELIGLVDNGNFGHQDSDWTERAENLLNANK